MKPMTIHTLKDLVRELKVQTLHAGRYPTPCKAENWERRDKSRAFRCIAYNTNVRRINALEEVIFHMESRVQKHSTRLTDEAVNSGSCNNGELGKKCDQS